jgi:NDP-sugar pyrophosphorylase family protein
VEAQGALIEELVLVGDEAEVSDDATLNGPVVIGDGARVGDGATLNEAVLLPGAEIGAGRAERGLYGPGPDNRLD